MVVDHLTERGVKHHFVPALGLLVLLVLLSAGCAKIPHDYPRDPSRALPEPAETRLARWIDPQLSSHAGLSCYRLLLSPSDAYVARLMLIDAADRTLDVQYFIFEDDLTGKLLSAHLLAAADRGVRVRLLVDDWNQEGKDHYLARLAAHRNIEARTFNPVTAFRTWSISRPVTYALGPKRIQKRMHNKALIADNTAVIVGGRNIGDEYFAALDSFSFGDVDLLALGPIAKPVSANFDEYWNDDLAIPIEEFVGLSAEDRDHADHDLQEARRTLAAHSESMKDSPYVRQLRDSDLFKQLEAGTVPVVWAAGDVLSDHPSKTVVSPATAPAAFMAPQLREILDQAKGEALLITPYLVPGPADRKLLRDWHDRGVTARILTNSLASNDEPAAHAGYARYRKELLRLGIDLYEVKPSGRRSPEDDGNGGGGGSGNSGGGSGSSGGGSSRVALHAKVLILDRELIFVGSYNLDQRSARLDTQNGIVVRSPELAGELARLFQRQTSPDNAFHVLFRGAVDGDQRLPPKDTRLVWIGLKDDKPVRYSDEPLTGVGRKFYAWFLGLIVPEKSL